MNAMLKSALTICCTFGLAASSQAQCVRTEDGSGVQCVDLLAGQTIDAGDVCVEVVGDNLSVTYNTTDGWELVEAHLWVGADIDEMPQTRKGNPKIGNFPYHSGDITGQTSYQFLIPLADLSFSCPSDDITYFVASHASLRKDNGDGTYQTETGWGDGDRFVEKGSWATFSSIILTCDCGDGPKPPDQQCETAFAQGGVDEAICFLNLDLNNDGNGDFNRWGWTNCISDNNPDGDTQYVWPIYAGAGQCDVSKGTLVGTLLVTFESTTGDLTVLYDMAEGFTLNEVHINVSCDPVPIKTVQTTGPHKGEPCEPTDEDCGKPTVAPGQYTLVVDGLSTAGWDWAYALGENWSCDNDTGCVYIIAHAVVCGDEELFNND